MKTFLALLISCLTLSAATTYPVLTDSANRLFPGGVTNVFFLNSNAVSVGTLRVTGAVTLTNSGNVFKGDGSGLTGIISYTNLANGANTVLATNLVAYSSGTTNWALRAGSTNGATTFFVNKDGVVVTKNVASSGPSFSINDPSGEGYGFTLNTDGYGMAFVVRGSGATGPNLAEGMGVGNLYVANRVGWGQNMTVGREPGDSVDLLITRDSSAMLKIVNTSAALRDLATRSFYATNAYVTNLIVNGGATVTKILSATASLNFDLSAVTVEDLTITVTGAATGDVVSLGVPNGSVTTSVQYTAWVSAADTVTVRARTSASGEDPASGTFRATVIKH